MCLNKYVQVCEDCIHLCVNRIRFLAQMLPFTFIHIALTFMSGDTEVWKVLLTRQKKV